MNCSPNIITANFSGGRRKAKTAWRHQWDRGQVLCVTGIEDLPLTFTAHFSVHKEYGAAQPVEGIDGQVEIPDIWLTFGKQVYCWIYLTDGESGETVYTITIPVIPRPMPEYYEMEDTGVFDAVVAQVGEYAQSAEASATAAAGSAQAAAQSASAAAASEESAAESADRAEYAMQQAVAAQNEATTQATIATEKASQASGYATAAGQSATSAEQSKTAAANAAMAAGQAASAAGNSATAAAGSASAAEAKAGEADQSATDAAESATAAAGSATAASGSAATAAARAAEAVNAAGQAATARDAAAAAQGAAETAASGASQSATAAAGSATAAAGSATAAAGSATTASTKADEAAASAAAAAASAASLTVDSALSDSSTNPVQNKVITGELTDVKSAIDALKITDTASGAIASFPDGAAMPMENLTVELEPIQEGTGDPSPDNIRPITGRESVTVVRTGKNLCDMDAYIVPQDSSWHILWEGDLTGTYTVSLDKSGVTNVVSPGARFLILSVDGANVYVPYNQTATITGHLTKILCVGGTSYAQVQGTIRVQIELGSTASEYEPYDGQSVTIALGQTVYGGTVDVTGGSALKTMDIRDLSALTWKYYAADNYFYATMGNRFPNGTNGKGFCSAYKFYGTANSATLASMPDMNFGFTSNSGSKYIYIKDSRYTDAASFQAAVAGVQLVYDLQPSSYEEITTAPVEMTTLKGQNNVWSDADSVSVDYVADPKLYIARLTEPDADMIADANITSGSYFMVGNSLYLATANIASGAAITPGVNCTKTNLASALNAINS